MTACLTLISRTYCHLCHEMEAEVRVLAERHGWDVELIDVDSHPELLALYDERVPVLLHEGEVLSQYFLDPTKVRDYLSKIG